MSERLQTLKYTLTVEGETEQWYFQWLRDQINSCPERTYNISINAKVQQSPERFYKGTTRKVTPEVTHICDMESNEKVHVEKVSEDSFRNEGCKIKQEYHLFAWIQ